MLWRDSGSATDDLITGEFADRNIVWLRAAVDGHGAARLDQGIWNFT